MDTFTINIAKGKSLGSEDYVGCRHTSDYTVIVQCDGNGELGSRSKKFQLGGKEYSEIAITTSKYGQRLLSELEYSFRHRRTSVTRVARMAINRILEDQYGDTMNVYFCLLVCIIDREHGKLYSYSIGDCGYMLIDMINSRYATNPPQIVNTLKLHNNYLRAIPNSSKYNPDLEEAEIDLPDKYTLIVYSDGIGWDKIVPVNLVSDTSSLTDSHMNICDQGIISEFNLALVHPIGNIDEQRLFNMLSISKKASEHGQLLIDEIYPLLKVDDVSFCIVCDH